jgi:TPR repeat protein
MRTFRARFLRSVAGWTVIALAVAALPVQAQVEGATVSETAADAALSMANILDGVGGRISSDDLVLALQDAAESGLPTALWQLGLMYENGEGVEKNAAKAFGYFSQIADEHADTAPKGIEADIVGRSFVKIGEYYRSGLPEAGIPKDKAYSNRLLMHAASYFGDADAQYRVGKLFLDDEEFGPNPLQGARWMSLAARKGHVRAQAQLGDMLFNGKGIEANAVEGLMWLTVASRHSSGTPDEAWIQSLLRDAMSVATPEYRMEAVKMADSLASRFGG